MFSWR